MSCNAHNHRPGCDCGWGGVFYGLGLSNGARYWGRNESYTNPNSRCPQCGALVYFYRSIDGGSVYFDDLGPPWPKHPCMDARKRTLATKPGRQLLGPPAWMDDGWHPLDCEEIDDYKPDTRLIRISVTIGDEKNQLFAKRQAANLRPNSPMLWRRKDSFRGWYEISTVDHSNSGFREVRFDASRSVEAMIDHVRSETAAIDAQSFVNRMRSITDRLVAESGTSAPLDKLGTIIERFRLRLIDGESQELLLSLASDSIKGILKGELQRVEKLDKASELHEVLIIEAKRIAERFGEYAPMLRGPLKRARMEAVQTLLSLEEAIAHMEQTADAKITSLGAQLGRRHIIRDLDAYIIELMEKYELHEKQTKSTMQKAAREQLNNCLSIDSIKQNLLGVSLAYKASSEIAAQRQANKEKNRQLRSLLIFEMLSEIHKNHPTIEMSFLDSSIAKQRDSGASVDNIRKKLTEAVNSWLTAKVRERHQQQAPQKRPRSTTFNRNGTAKVNSTKLSAPLIGTPFNRVLADKLATALMVKEPDAR